MKRQEFGIRLSDIREVIRELNPVLRGWGGYFRTGNASGKFNEVDSYVHQRLFPNHALPREIPIN